MLVNNSGTSWGEPLEKHSVTGWDKARARLPPGSPRVVVVVSCEAPTTSCLNTFVVPPPGPQVMDLNVKGIFFLTKALLPLLDRAATAEDPARVINVGSIAGIRPQVRQRE